ncbi:MAG: nucleotidyltransferase family protein [Betaproteobacteria bacterium]|nr:nucleotidyltransferase family protein [Betaproteobacteria bacterium]
MTTVSAAPISTKRDLLRLLRANESVIRNFGVARLGVFGSFRRDAARTDSDVDLFVEFRPGETTFDHFMGLSFFCEELVGRRVEIVTPNSLSPHLGPRILADVEYVLP